MLICQRSWWNWAFYTIIPCLSIAMATAAEPAKQSWTSSFQKAQAEEASGELLLAEMNYKRALEEAKASHADPESIRELTVQLTAAYVHNKKLELAEPLYQELINSNIVHTKRDSKASRESLVWLDDLADSYASILNPATRENCLKHALAIKEKLFGKDDEHSLRILNDMFLFYNVHQRYTDAEPILRRRLGILQSDFDFTNRVSSLDAGTMSFELASTEIELISVQSTLKQFRDLETTCEYYFPIFVSHLGPTHIFTAVNARGVALGALKQGKVAKATDWAQKAVQLSGSSDVRNNIEYARDLFVLGRVFEQQSDLAKAEKTYRDTILAVQRISGLGSTELVAPLDSLAKVLRKSGKDKEAAEIEKQSKVLQTKITPGSWSIIAQDAV